MLLWPLAIMEVFLSVQDRWVIAGRFSGISVTVDELTASIFLPEASNQCVDKFKSEAPRKGAGFPRCRHPGAPHIPGAFAVNCGQLPLSHR